MTSTHTLPDTPCYLNGEFSTLKDAKISVLDRGFIFGDGVYEVLPSYGGKLFRFEHHMARLDRSLTELRIPNPMSRSEWRALTLKLIADCANPRGPASKRTCSSSTFRLPAAWPCVTTQCCRA